jgi:hypothetical protein
MLKPEHLPRQARVKHRKSATKRARFCRAGWEVRELRRLPDLHAGVHGHEPQLRELLSQGSAGLLQRNSGSSSRAAAAARRGGGP